MFPRTGYAIFGALAAVLVGCGSGSERGAEVDYSHLEQASPVAEPLSNQHDLDSFANYLKNGLRLQVAGGQSRPSADVAMMAEAASDTTSRASGNFSDTNVHVQGVDEADLVKYDGEYLYVLGTPRAGYNHQTQPQTDVASTSTFAPSYGSLAQSIRILRTNPEQAQATAVAEIPAPEDDDNQWRSQLYLHETEQGKTQSLIAISEIYEPVVWLEQSDEDVTLARPMLYQPARTTARLDVFDVATPEDPRVSWTLDIDGHLINSRKVGSILYLVTRHRPQVEGMIHNPSDSAARQSNEQRIAQAPISELLPSFQIDAGEPSALVRENDCFLPKSLKPNQGYAEIVTISAFDMDTRALVSSVCLNTQVSGLYASPTSLYLGATVGDWEQRETGVHKFQLDEGQIAYRGTGKVRGSLNWAAPSFSMDEQDGYLRIVTTDRSRGWNDPHHELNVLRSQEGSDVLEVVVTLPNAEEPAAIGKPGEDIYAVRFLGDRGYIVTFERIDPLYVLDLSDHHSPSIAGELEVPGFATYLHPVGDGYLASVGQDADENGMPTEVKIELFDVRDISNPQSVGRHLVGGRGSWSQALNDLQSFNFLQVGDDQFRFTVPVSNWSFDIWRENRLYLYEINGVRGEAELQMVGSLLAEGGDHWRGSARARLHDDTLFYIHDGKVWSSFWESPELVNGPF
ncbi:beta-propeller domain-containing protein [Marinimicrobium sp. ABcell2]|uniref:beta-propeller domain-containing protein n=1 Tax=Marinimicrobium sp. ABcell2 TaxID=3069751 RepID=UPI0027ADB822|nr:beta-propeller domain-containing protein [Marinimicrobium sp. ABcell2]MDQ2075731.1 beta-propeller domain-containing protein [Marinimicrobium sp. ABcell2]